MVRAKFKVNRIERSMGSRRRRDADGHVVKTEGREVYDPCEMQTIVMTPVYQGGDPNAENSKFWEASPSGELKLGTVNARAAAMFQLDKEYYIDFSPATPEANS